MEWSEQEKMEMTRTMGSGRRIMLIVMNAHLSARLSTLHFRVGHLPSESGPLQTVRDRICESELVDR